MSMLVFQKKTGTGLVLPQSWDLSSATYTGKSYNFTSEGIGPTDVIFNPAGTKMWVMLGGTEIYDYNLSTAWDIATVTFSGTSKSMSFIAGSNNTGLWLKDDGLKLYTVHTSFSNAYQSTMSPAYDITSLAFEATNSVNAQNPTPQSVVFTPDGTKYFVVSADSNNTVARYTPNSAWDWTFGGTHDAGQTFNSSAQTGNNSARDVHFSTDGTKMFIITSAAAGVMPEGIYQYTLSTPWDLTTASYDSVSLDTTSEDSLPYGMFFHPTENKLYVVGQTGDKVYQYDT